MEKRDKVYWHEPFFEGLQLDLHEYRDFLDYESEHPLSKEALIVDVVVVRNEKNVKIKNSIGKIFRRHNLFEFKSEQDSLSIHDYDKVMGYARLYSAFGKIPYSDITVSFALTIYPRELEKSLENERGLKVRDMSGGIHYVEGETYPVQILERKKLTKENLFIKNLCSGLSAEDIIFTTEAYEKIRPLDMRNVYFDRLMQANLMAFEEAMKMSEALKELYFKVLREDEWFRKREDEWFRKRENAKITEEITEELKKVAKKLLLRNRPIDEVAETTGLPIETVESLH